MIQLFECVFLTIQTSEFFWQIVPYLSKEMLHYYRGFHKTQGNSAIREEIHQTWPELIEHQRFLLESSFLFVP